MFGLGKKEGRLGGGNIPGGRRGMAANAAMAMGVEHRLEVRLPKFYVLRLVARSLLALAFLSFNVLRIGPQQGNVAAAAVAAATGGAPPLSVDDAIALPMLFRDLKRQGLFRPGDRALILGGRAAGARLARILRQNRVELVTGCEGGSGCRGLIPDGTVDFVFSDAGFRDAEFVDRVLKKGGVAAVRLSLNSPAGTYRMASNYKIVYVRRFDSTVVAMRKVVEESQNVVISGWQGRRLLTVPETRKEALDGLEDVLLEPPRFSRRRPPVTYLKRTKYLPDLTGDTLDNYPRRVFVDVVTGSQWKAGTAATGGADGGAGWFSRNYPTRKRAFEIIRVQVETEKAADHAGAAEEDEDEDEDEEEDEMSRWLRRNVREEEYVVMKAEAGVVEGMVRSGAVALVDELFLQCGHGGRGTGRAYWECLALYGKLRDAGVAVHQWWWV